MNAAPPARAGLAFVQFKADPFAGEFSGRKALIECLRPWPGGLLILDQPEGLSGHFGGNTALFANRYGACVLRYVTESAPVSNC